MHVCASQVERPCHVVQRRHQHAVGVKLAQSLPDARQFALGGLAGISHGVHCHLVGGYGWAVCPYIIENVEVGAHRDASLASKVGDEALGVVKRVDHAVYAHRGAAKRSQFGPYPLGDGGRAGHPELHQSKLGALQLLGRRQEITAVCPQRRRPKGHHGRSGGAVETANPLSAFPSLGHILAVMWVGTWKNKSVEFFSSHLLS